MIRVTAVDADGGRNAAVTYQIVEGADGKFIIEGEAHHVSIVSSVSHRDIVVLTKKGVYIYPLSSQIIAL